MALKIMDNGSSIMSKEHAGELFNQNIKGIKKMIKRKANTYYLDYETVSDLFVEKVKANDHEMIRNIPAECSFETYIEAFIRNFMIEQAYFLLEEQKFIEKVVGKIAKKEKISPEVYWDILTFVREESEKNNFERLKRFEERKNSKFTSFFYPVVCNLAVTFLRKHNRIRKASERYVDEIIEAFSGSTATPEQITIMREEEEIKKKIRRLVPELMKQLDDEECVVFRMIYLEKNENFSAIGRSLKISRYKVEKMARGAWDKIVSGVKKAINQDSIKKGDDHGTPARR